MLKPFAYICALVSLATSFPAFAQTAKTQTPAATPQPKVERASWSESAETAVGISHDDFTSMGLSKLTKDQYVNLLTWAYKREARAIELGKDAGKAEGRVEGRDQAVAMMATYSCGLQAIEEKVHLLVRVSDDMPSQIASGVREALRRISDVTIVYDSKDADLVVSLLGYENQTESNHLTGYTVSMTTAIPCVSKLGTNSWDFEMVNGHFLQTGGRDPKALVDTLVSTLDAKDIESIRQGHALFKKATQEKKQ